MYSAEATLPRSMAQCNMRGPSLKAARLRRTPDPERSERPVPALPLPARLAPEISRSDPRQPGQAQGQSPHGASGPARAVERRLGIGKGMICRWKRPLAAQGEDAFPGKGHLPAHGEQLRRMQRELCRVTRERDIWRNALAIFSQERYWDATGSSKAAELSAGDATVSFERVERGGVLRADRHPCEPVLQLAETAATK